MATTRNQVDVGLKGQTGTGTFVGATAPTMSNVTIDNFTINGNTITVNNSNGSINFQTNGTGVYNFLGTSATAAEIRLFEDTDNGTNYVSWKAPASIAANVTWIMPSADSSGVFQSNGSGTFSLTSTPYLTQILDVNGNEVLKFTGVGAATNEITISNATASPIIEATGGSTNIGINFQSKGTGGYLFNATSTVQAALYLYEQTTNGTNYIQVTVPTSISTNRSVGFIDAAGYVVLDSSSAAAWTDFSGSVGYTGFSANPTGLTALYKKIGNTCFIQINMTAGTSNATTFTITGLPFTSAGQNQITPNLAVTNNSAYTGAGDGVISASTTTLTLRVSGNGSGFTAGGTKGVTGTFFYETA